MKSKTLTIKVSESIGSVSGIIVEPEKVKFLMIVAHGAGAGMSHPFMETLSKQLAEHSVATLRFNFPFTENGKKRPDPAPVAEKTISAVWEKASMLYPNVPLLAAGKSFGGRMSSHVLSKAEIPYIKGVVFFGFPLHAPGQASVSRAEHLKSVGVPMLFLQGTRDALADLKLMKQVTGGLETATLVTFDGADHSFKVGKNVIIPDLTEAALTWINGLGIK